MKRHLFALHLLMLIALGASMNACIVAKYQISAQESQEGRAKVAVNYDGPVYFVIPQYYRYIFCGWGTPWCKNQRDRLGTQMYHGVAVPLDETPLGKRVEFTEEIRSQGLVCVVSVEEQLTAETRYSEIFSLITVSVIPSYTTRTFVLNYSLLFDFKTVKEYQYHISEEAILGGVSWILYPLLYPFWDDIEIGLPYHGPRARVIREATRRFLIEAHRDGIFRYP
jgi:hypothetical protein